MARRKTTDQNGPGLFDEQVRRLERRIRRQRALFIPHLLRDAALSLRLRNEAQDRAFAIALDWANLESSGRLTEFKETAVDTQFLDQIFGAGLGYQVKTTSPDAWQLEHKYYVREVGTADAALGDFPKSRDPTVMVELKDSRTDLDRDRSSGRTAVQQCWDYLNAVPSCTWGIVSNFSTIRLYHRDKGTLAYEEFTLQELRRRERFNEFYYLFERDGLVPSRIGQTPRAIELLERTQDRQRSVGDKLYDLYQSQRLRLIEHLMQHFGKELNTAIRIAQKLLDRIIFIAFCEDRGLLKEHCLDRAWRDLPAFTKATNPRWQGFLALFKEVDSGGKSAGVDEGYNGNLFKEDDDIDSLELTDDPWTLGFKSIGAFDFSEEVNVEVLGHIFERSITELEKLRVGGLFALKAATESSTGATGTKRRKKKPSAAADEPSLSKMPKSAQRKRFGIYYTPPAFTGLIVDRTVNAIVAQRFAELQAKHKVDPEARENQNQKKLLAYWQACLEALQAVTVCDPACGSGAFLIRAYDALDAHYTTVIHGLAGAGLDGEAIGEIEEEVPDLILNNNLYGVDLSEQAVEITQLALWIRSARKNRKLSDLSRNIVWGNSLVSDSAVDPKALVWETTFPAIFGKKGSGGFTCVIGNPPWERVKVQNREFFSLSAPEVLETDNAAALRSAISKLETTNPNLFKLYQSAIQQADSLLAYVRSSGRFPLTARGDTNLYMLFAELGQSIVHSQGVVGLLVPSGIATDEPTKEFFADLMTTQRLELLYDFENRKKIFPDVDGRFKFTALIYGGSDRMTNRADFLFFAHSIDDTAARNKKRHISLTAADVARVNPNTMTCPIFRTRQDSELTLSIYERIPILLDRHRKTGGNSWGLRFSTTFHQSADAALFINAAKVQQTKKPGKTKLEPILRVYEAKMVQAFDHRAASVRVEGTNWARKGQKHETVPVQHQNPEYLAQPRWWVREADVIEAVGERRDRGSIAYKDITSATNTRTLIAAALPWSGATHHLALAKTDQGPRRELCLLANFNAIVLDYVVRQKLGGTTLTFFIMEQLPVLPPDTYADKCPWAKKETLERWISERVLKLSCTAEDMIPLAKACGFKGSRGDGVHLWKEAERAEIRAELDAAYFHLYEIERDDAQYMLSTFTNTGFVPESERGSQQFLWNPGSTGQRILDAFDRLAVR